MAEFLSSLVQFVYIFTVIFVLIIAGIFVVKKFRDHANDEVSRTSDMTTTFREIHVRGDLTDEEYRTIKTVLATKDQKQSKDINH